MARLKMSDISGWDANKIDAKVGELRKELFDMKMQKAASGTDKPHKFKELKSDIARLLTVRTSQQKATK